MKALTLWQPWATLVAVGAKRIETRGWSTTHRGPLAIHAAKHKPERSVGPYFVEQLPKIYGGEWTLRGPGITSTFGLILPRGAVVATCNLLYVVSMDRCSPPLLEERDYGDLPQKGWDVALPELDDGDDTVLVRDDQRRLGDFSKGRFAWLLDDVRPLDRPVPAKGRQKLWDWTE